MKRLILLAPLLYLSILNKSFAEDTFAYFGFEPDIITNYITSKKKPGYVRITVELMLEDASYIEVVEHHSPLLRDAIVDILGKEPEEKIKSLKGREEVRALCAQQIKLLLKQETGQEIIRDVLFTNYLYH
ncbi:flagellar basal body-associated protein FliL [Catenovulum sp. 2E275]|uniref:flagellar basal body-associated protein FliL n=1 Tax=Catenovulum sp. 2E275 TaxID=2980497 RepID=UPI0021D262FC|nr:flagellar basal body-associated protein FliL [Catenovulum sp. 2E275]MCU4674357.1 flagellar basal body-associated protein FliL [Catenovulum sp. 2E275]